MNITQTKVHVVLTHLKSYWKRSVNPFVPTVPTFAVRETASLGIMGETAGAPLKPLRDDSVLRALSSLRGLTVGMNELIGPP